VFPITYIQTYRMLKFRYTLANSPQDTDVSAWISEISPCHFVVQHDADKEVTRTHWHASLRPTKTIAAVRIAFSRRFPLVSKSDFSLGVVKDGEEDIYERYMCHAGGEGDPVRIIRCQGLSYSQSWADAQNAAFYAAQSSFKARVKAKSRGGTVEDLLAECVAAQVATRRDVTLRCIDMFARQKRAMVENYMRAVITTVCVSLEIEKAKYALADRLDFFSC